MKIGGRFEFDPESGQVQVWFSTGGHRIFDAKVEGEDILRAFRGEVPIRLTGGRAVQYDNRTWAEQLKGLSADAWLKQNKPKAKVKEPEVGLTEEEFNEILGSLL